MTTAAFSCISDGNEMASFLDQPTYDLLLRRAASILRRESLGHLFEPGDLVQEAFLRIARSAVPMRFHSATHIVALATVVMRRIMIDHSRTPRAAGRLRSVPLHAEYRAAERRARPAARSAQRLATPSAGVSTVPAAYRSCFNSTTITSIGFSPAFTSACIWPGGFFGSQ